MPIVVICFTIPAIVRTESLVNSLRVAMDATSAPPVEIPLPAARLIDLAQIFAVHAAFVAVKVALDDVAHLCGRLRVDSSVSLVVSVDIWT
jgi:hypothetical protein